MTDGEGSSIVEGFATLAAGSSYIGGMSEETFKRISRGHGLSKQNLRYLVSEVERSIAKMTLALEGIKEKLEAME